MFPEGTSGAQLDVLARKALWQDGLNYGVCVFQFLAVRVYIGSDMSFLDSMGRVMGLARI